MTPTSTAKAAGRGGAASGASCSDRSCSSPGPGHVAVAGYVLYLILTGAVGAGAGAIRAALTTVGVPDDAVIRYETAIKAGKQLLIAHETAHQVQHARGLLTSTNAESVETHIGEPRPVANPNQH
jgi:hypothetical protein